MVAGIRTLFPCVGTVWWGETAKGMNEVKIEAMGVRGLQRTSIFYVWIYGEGWLMRLPRSPWTSWVYLRLQIHFPAHWQHPTSSTCASSSPPGGKGSSGGWESRITAQPSLFPRGNCTRCLRGSTEGSSWITYPLYSFPPSLSSCLHSLIPTCWNLPASRPSTSRSFSASASWRPRPRRLQTRSQESQLPDSGQLAQLTWHPHKGLRPPPSQRRMSGFSWEENRLPFGGFHQEVTLIPHVRWRAGFSQRSLCLHQRCSPITSRSLPPVQHSFTYILGHFDCF